MPPSAEASTSGSSLSSSVSSFQVSFMGAEGAYQEMGVVGPLVGNSRACGA